MMGIFAADMLKDRHVLVTGASSGLGRATAQALAIVGARLTLLGRDHERLEATQSSLAGDGHMVRLAPLSDIESAADIVKAAATDGGPIDGIFHSAGTELVRPIRMFKSEHAAELFGPAIYGSLGIARAAASRGIMNDGASIVFMSSVSGMRGTAGMVGYSAAKAAVDGMTRSLACELSSRRIRVNSIAAGAIVTEMHDRLSKSLGEAAIADYERRHLLGFGQPSDISSAVIYLMSQASAWVTGTTMVIDGGYSAQ